MENQIIDKYILKDIIIDGNAREYSSWISQNIYEELLSYRDAKEKGLLHKTPVAIGQTVYVNHSMSGWYMRDKDRPYKAKVVYIGLNLDTETGNGYFNVELKKGCMLSFTFSDVGKLVFLTEEEAIQSLSINQPEQELE